MILTSKELADRWKMTDKIFRQWIMENQGPRSFTLGEGDKASVRYRLEDVEVWEKQHDIGGKNES